MSFRELFSHPEILKAIEEAGYVKPTQIQEEAIPEVIKGHDIQACAQTGTGKTAAFILPALLKVSTPSEIKGKGPRILVLVPTRELAMQVAAEAIKYSKGLSMVKTVCIYGGQPFPIQNKELSRHYEILVATPGRLIDHMERGHIDFSRLEMLVLDEADRMLDMGFIDDVEHIAEATSENRQTLMFSATLKPSVLKLSKRLLKDPIEIRITPEEKEDLQIQEKLHFVDNITHKFRILEDLLIDPQMNQGIIFTATKRYADELTEKLCEMGHKAGVLHGDLKQSHRTRTIGKMRQGKIRILVATDVAARGIDVPAVTHVINFDLPNNAEDYVHRIGRTGRAGAAGIAISFVSPKDRSMIREIERFTGKTLLSEEERKKELGRPKKAEHQKKRDRSQNFKREKFKSRPISNDSREESRPWTQKRFRNENDGASRAKPFREEYWKRPKDDTSNDSRKESKPWAQKRLRNENDEKINEKPFREDYRKRPKDDTSIDFREESKPWSQKRFRNENDVASKGKPLREEYRKRPKDDSMASKEKSARRNFQKRPQQWRKNDDFADKAKPFREPRSEKTQQTSDGYFSKRKFKRKPDLEFQGSNIHREKAKLSGHRRQNATFSRKRRSSMHRQNVVKSKNIPFLPTEA